MARFLSLFALAFAISATEARAAKVLVITGDEYHAWKQTAPFIKDLLAKAGHTVEVTETPSKDLTPENLKRFDVLVLNYRNTPKGAKDNPASVWSNENKQAFLDAIQSGKGLYVYHWASSAFTTDSAIDKEYERALAGGWRKQGNHGKPHAFSVTVRKDHEDQIHQVVPSLDPRRLDGLDQPAWAKATSISFHPRLLSPTLIRHQPTNRYNDAA